MSHNLSPARCRALFLSDLHLGARAARPGAILDFLAAHEAETIYLVGDIFDLWHGGRVHWSEKCDALVEELSRRAATGTRVVYLAGNHDTVMRDPCAPRQPEGWEMREAVIHKAADGQRYLVLHGDQADSRLFRFHFMTRIGSRVEAAVRVIDSWLGNPSPAQRAPQERSQIDRLIARFNGMFVMAGRFERKLTDLARAAGAHGVVCGHSHKPLLHEVGGITFANCGDWVDSFTALTEDFDGTLRLVSWEAPTATTAPSARPPLVQEV